MASASFTIEPLTPTTGAELIGLDLTRPLAPPVLDQVYQALLDHLEIFSRHQGLTPAAQLAFAESFGAISRPHPIYPHAESHPHVMLLQNSPDKKPDTNEWHSDLTFYDEPPIA